MQAESDQRERDAIPVWSRENLRAQQAEARAGRATSVAGILIIGVLCAVCLGLAFQSGAYSPAEWLPSLIGVAALALVVIIGGPSVSSDRFQKILLGLFAAQALWTAASIIWATSAGNAWEEINRTLFYTVGVALTFAAVRWAGLAGLSALAALVTGAIGVIALVMAIRLGVSNDPLSLFAGGRLNYPITYFNGLASLLVIGFWLALGMANGAGRARICHAECGETGAKQEARDASRSRTSLPRWAQPLLLALSVFFVELALLPQSRGALWTFFLVLPFFVILSPHRFRALLDLGIVVLPVVLFWNRINGVYAAISEGTPLDTAISSCLGSIGFSVLIVAAAWVLTWLVERWIGPLSRRLTVWIGLVLIIFAVGAATGGLVYANQRTGGLGDYLGDRWTEFTSDQGIGSDSKSRFAAVGLNGRLTQWKVAAKAFGEEPVLGIGAQNFELYHYEHRTTLLEVRQPHSQPMQLLAELGFPGLVLWVAFVALTLIRTGLLRFRYSNRVDQAVIAAVMTAVLSWFIHSSADWLWQLAAVSLPAMMLLGGLVGAGAKESHRLRTDPSHTSSATTELPPDKPQRPPQALSRVGARGRRRSSLSFRVIRPIMGLLALLIVASAAFPYLSLRYSELASGAQSAVELTARARTAAMLDPTSLLPFSVRAGAHRAAAAQEPEGSIERLEQLRLAAEAWVEATKREPGGWLYFYKAGEMFLAARDAAREAGASSVEDLAQQAQTYLTEARRLNPLSPQLDALEEAY